MASFDFKLLQAINDWQKGGKHVKASRGKKLKALAAALETRFRTVDQPCYRRIDLDDPGLQLLGETLRLPETISAWTLSPEIAQGHNDGVPAPGGKIGMIVRLEPMPSARSVVINLDALFSDPCFREGEANFRDRIKEYDRGMGRYSNHQREVIIECSEVRLNQVWAWGGHSSSREELLAGMRTGRYGLEYTTPEAIEIVHRGLEAEPDRLGRQWLMGPEAVARVRSRLEHRAKARAARHRGSR
jgi:hypothetical protein